MSPVGRTGETQQPRVAPAKVRVPTPRLDVVSRARLLARLDDDRSRVVLVSAPAGSGKTVLALDWLKRSGRPAAWFSIDRLDNDPSRFLAHLAAAVRTLEGESFQRAATLLDELSRTGRASDPRVVEALAKGDEAAVLVLDDVQHVEATALLGLLEALVTGLHGGPRLVLLSRVDPPLPLGRIRLSGELLELRQRDLRFTREEASDLFDRLLPSGLDPDLVARLEERTEGWVAGLRLAAVVLERAEDATAAVEAFTGSHELMVDYLLEEAVGGQEEELQRFLMDTSILPRFTAATCAAVTDDEAAGRHLETVDEANLFLVSLDDRRTWYRYHHLFAELLEFRLGRLHPERLEALRERASRWFEGEGDVQEALRQAARMDDPTRLLELLDRHGYPILARSEFASFARWLERVPEPLSERWPMFLVALAWFRAQTERGPDLGRLLEAIEAAAADPPEGYPEARIREARLHLDALRAFALRIGDRFEESIALGREVLDRLPPGATTIRGVLEFNLGAVHLRLADMGAAREQLEQAYDSCLQAGSPYLVLASMAHLGAVAAQTEGLEAARQRLESAVAFAEERGWAGVPAFGIVLYQLAHVHFLADDLEPARAALERALAITRDERETDIHANVLIHMARLDAAGGRLDDAGRRLTEAAALAHGHNVKPFATTLDVERARLAEARTGRLQTPESAPPSADTSGRWSSWREAETLLQLQHSLKLGRREEVAELAERLRHESEPRGRGVALAVARIAEAAVAPDAAGRREALVAGLTRAARCGYVRPILDCGAPARALLEAGLGGRLPPDVRAFVRDRLLPRFPASAAAPSDLVEGPAEELTDRELETLALLAGGRTNKAIARQLFVSVNTVKTHLKRVYAKLGVSTRTEAVARARALGLAPPPDEG